MDIWYCLLEYNITYFLYFFSHTKFLFRLGIAGYLKEPWKLRLKALRSHYDTSVIHLPLNSGVVARWKEEELNATFCLLTKVWKLKYLIFHSKEWESNSQPFLLQSHACTLHHDGLMVSWTCVLNSETERCTCDQTLSTMAILFLVDII